MARRAWKISAPARSASAKVGMPTGMTMNSCRSTLLSACAPPFRMFIIGTGSRYGASPVRAARERGEVCVERDAGGRGRGTRHGHRHAEHGVGAEPALGRRAVERHQHAVEIALIERPAHDRLGDLAVDVRHGLSHALAEIARLVAVAQLERLALARGGARGHGGASQMRAGPDVHFHRGVAARVENFASVNACDRDRAPPVSPRRVRKVQFSDRDRCGRRRPPCAAPRRSPAG